MPRALRQRYKNVSVRPYLKKPNELTHQTLKYLRYQNLQVYITQLEDFYKALSKTNIKLTSNLLHI